MSSPTKHPPIDRHSPHLCASCQGQTAGWGIVAKSPEGTLWSCSDPDCFLAITRSWKMPNAEFSRLENLAAEIGGQEGGEYLDEIGKSDLGTLTSEEYAQYVERVIWGYRHALHEKLKEESPF